MKKEKYLPQIGEIMVSHHNMVSPQMVSPQNGDTRSGPPLPLRLHITLFSVQFNGFEVIRSQSLKVSKSYQDNRVTLSKKLLRVPKSFSIYSEITWSNL